MKTIIVANGILTDDKITSARLKRWEADRVLCADGGARNAVKLGLSPDLIIGDMDSLMGERAFNGIESLHFPVDKDESDLELALLQALQEGADEIIIAAAMGGRMDMVLANFLLLTHPALERVEASIWEGLQTAQVLRPPGGSYTGTGGDALSLLPLTQEVTSIRTKGLRFPLRDETLFFGPARGISNVMTGDEAKIWFSKGLLMLVHTRTAGK